METPQKSGTLLLRILRGFARSLSALIIVIMLVFFVGEGLLGSDSLGTRPLEASAVFQLILAGIELVGLGLAWKWEAPGALITLVAYIIKAAVNQKTLMFPLLLIPFTAILFLLCWYLSQPRKRFEATVEPPTNN